VLDDADRALQVAVVGDLDDGQARVLLVVWAQAAVVGAALLDLCRVLERFGALLDVGQRLQEPVGVSGDQRLGLAVGRALLAQEHLAVADDARAVYGSLTLWAQAFAEGVEDLRL